MTDLYNKCINSTSKFFSRNNRHSLMEWLAPKMLQFGWYKFEESLQKEALEYLKQPVFLQKLKDESFPSVERNIILNMLANLNPEKKAAIDKQIRDMKISNQLSPFQMHNLKTNLIAINTEAVQKTDLKDSGISKSSDNNKLLCDSNNKNAIAKIQNNETPKVNISPGRSQVNDQAKLIENKPGDLKVPEEHLVRPKLAYVSGKWILINKDNEEYDFKLTFNKWMLVQKDKDGRIASKQDDFMKNFICWKKHFPTYSKEILAHPLHSTCLNPKMKSTFNTCRTPTTYWDFPASVPADMRPPKTVILSGAKKCIKRGCGYGFVCIRNNWILVTKNDLGMLVTRNKMRKVVWTGYVWSITAFTESENAAIALRAKMGTKTLVTSTPVKEAKHSITPVNSLQSGKEKNTPAATSSVKEVIHLESSPVKKINKLENTKIALKSKIVRNTSVQTSPVKEVERIESSKISLQTEIDPNTSAAPSPVKEVKHSESPKVVKESIKLEANELLICDDEDIEIPSDNLILTEKLQLEELKTTYVADTEPETTITAPNLELNFITNVKNTTNRDEMRNKWKKLFDSVPYVPKLALIEGYWTNISEKSDLKMYKKNNKWIVLEENPETKKFCELKDDFYPDETSKTEEEKSKTLGKFVFDHLPMPVTKYDFPSSVPSNLRPPARLTVKNKEIDVNPDSNYAFVSIKGQWIPVKKGPWNKWEAYNSATALAVKKKLSNMPVPKVDNKVIEIADEDEQIASASCTLQQLLFGCKQVKPLTYWEVGTSEEKRPPKLALANVKGEQIWCCVSPGCEKGFVLEDGVWVKVVRSECGEWKATQFDAHPGCIIGYRLFNNVWVIMKKYIIGGKWVPLFDVKTTPTTYWNYIGPEDKKPPQQIRVPDGYKTIHNNSNMGFIFEGSAWILMEKSGNDWKIVVENKHFHIFKLINGIWTNVQKDSKGVWSYKPISQKICTYITFEGLKSYAPPKEVNMLDAGKKVKKTIDEKSGMGFVSINGVWVLKKLTKGNLISMKNAQGQTNFGFKRIGDKFVIVRKDVDNKWVIPNTDKEQNQSELVERLFQNPIPVTYDRVLMNVPENLKPPKYALVRDVTKNKSNWQLIDEHSGFGFLRENDTWSLMKWISEKTWKDTLDENEYKYKIVNNMWTPVKYENNQWIPAFGPETLKVPQLCVETPESNLPIKITINSTDIKSKLNITPSSEFGYLKKSNDYVLARRMSSGDLCLYESSKSVFVFKPNDHGLWVMTTHDSTSYILKMKGELPDKVRDIGEIQTYHNTTGIDRERPPRYIKIKEGGVMHWKEIDLNEGYGFVKRKYWHLFKKMEECWTVVDKNQGFHIIDSRWVLMKKTDKKWFPDFKPHLTPRTSLESVGDTVVPTRVVTYTNGVAKYVNTAKDCSLAFKIEDPDIFILMRQQNTEWSMMNDDFEESHVMAYKLINCRWRRMKKDADEWVECSKQFDLPVLHIDLVGDCPKPPSHIRICLNQKTDLNMSFDVFSDEGFTLKDDRWLLMKFIKDEWVQYPGSFGKYSFEVDSKSLNADKTGKEKVIQGIPIQKVDEVTSHKGIPINNNEDKFSNANKMKTNDTGKVKANENTPSKKIEECPPEPTNAIPIKDPVTYKDIKNWPYEKKPPMDMLILLHQSHRLGGEQCTCNYGFVKYEDFWVAIEKNKDNTWKIVKNSENYHAYKLHLDRWVTMIKLDNTWIPAFDPKHTPQTHLDTYGKFQKKPPLRIFMINAGTWKPILTNSQFSFSKTNGMWVLMHRKQRVIWEQYSFQGNLKLGYKLVNGQWRAFTKSANENWKMYINPGLPVLSIDFVPGHKVAPPSPADFQTIPNFSSIDVGPLSDKGFLFENGAWILMEKRNDKWTKFEGCNFKNNSYGFMLERGVWKIVIRDVDGSWKPGSFSKSGKWIYEKIPELPANKKKLKLVPATKKVFSKYSACYERPPDTFVIFENTRARKVTLTSAEKTYGFERWGDAWVMLKANGANKWEIAGGLIAYKWIRRRWTLVYFKDKWIPSYDPITTPVTHFEYMEYKDQPPLRVALNETGVDKWKVIFQNSGYGFVKEGDMWVLMEKESNEKWKPHRDYFQELTGYKIVNGEWVRHKKSEWAWISKKSSLPSLPCDFSKSHSKQPPPSLNKIFLKDPKTNRGDAEIYLDLYSKFGFRLDTDVWVLMECQIDGSWREFKLSNNENKIIHDLLGYRNNGTCWRLLKKMENGKWVEGRLQYSKNDSENFVEDKINNPVKNGDVSKKIQNKQDERKPVDTIEPKGSNNSKYKSTLTEEEKGNVSIKQEKTDNELQRNINNKRGLEDIDDGNHQVKKIKAEVTVRQIDSTAVKSEISTVIEKEDLGVRKVESSAVQNKQSTVIKIEKPTYVQNEEDLDTVRNKEPVGFECANEKIEDENQVKEKTLDSIGVQHEESTMSKNQKSAVVQNMESSIVKNVESTVSENKESAVVPNMESSEVDNVELTVDRQETSAVVQNEESTMNQIQESTVAVGEGSTVVQNSQTSVVNTVESTAIQNDKPTIVQTVNQKQESIMAQSRKPAMVENIESTATQEEEYTIVQTEKSTIRQNQQSTVVAKIESTVTQDEKSAIIQTEKSTIIQNQDPSMVENKKLAVVQNVESTTVENIDPTLTQDKESVSVQTVKSTMNQNQVSTVIECGESAMVQNVESTVIQNEKSAIIQTEKSTIDQNQNPLVVESKESAVVQNIESTIVEKMESTVTQDKKSAVVQNDKSTMNQNQESFVIQCRESAMFQNVESTVTSIIVQSDKTAMNQKQELTLAKSEESAMVQNVESTIVESVESSVNQDEKSAIVQTDESSMYQKQKSTNTQSGELAMVQNVGSTVTQNEKSAIVQSDKSPMNQKQDITMVQSEESAMVQNEESTIVESVTEDEKSAIVQTDESTMNRNVESTSFQIEESTVVDNKESCVVEIENPSAIQNKKSSVVQNIKSFDENTDKTYKMKQNLITFGSGKRVENTKEEISEIDSKCEKQTVQRTKAKNNEPSNDALEKKNVIYNIPITKPVQYHQFTNIPIEDRPPKNVCLNFRGVPKRIPLVSMTSKLGFQKYQDVWVLLERFSGDWRILRNSSSIPLAYKLIENRWVTMRLNKTGGTWVPTFNLSKAPVTYFDMEGPDDIKPPQRIVMEDNGIFEWKEINDSGFGFLKEDDMWVLMKKQPNRDWVEYKTQGVKFGFKVVDYKWTKFTKTEDGEWKIESENLPVLHLDFVGDSEVAPPVMSQFLIKRTGKDKNAIGFLSDNGAWVLMAQNQKNCWLPLSIAKTTLGFVRSKGDIWNVVEKDKDGEWKTILSKCTFEMAFDYVFASSVKAEVESLGLPPLKKIKLEPVSPERNAGLNITHKSVDLNVTVKVESLERSQKRTDNVIESNTRRTVSPVESSNGSRTVISQPKNSSTSSERRIGAVSKGAEHIINNEVAQNENAKEGPKSNTEDSPTTTNSKERSVEENQAKDDKSTNIHSLMNNNQDNNNEELNSVEKYLAVKPDCCLGCPELQALLREFRPANNPNKILRKRFRLPGGGSRMLSIPKALPLNIQAQSETQKLSKIEERKRALASGSTVDIKRMKIIEKS